MWLGFLVYSIYMLLNPIVLELTSSNPNYRIRHAQATLFRADAYADFKNLPREKKEHLYASRRSLKQYLGHVEGKISEGVSENLLLSETGVYRAMFTQIVIVRSSDRTEFTVPCYIAKDFKITKRDIETGRFKIEISEPLFRVIVVDQEGKRVAENLELSFEPPTDGPTEMTFEFKTDNGELVFLGDPLKYRPQVLDKPWLRIRTEPLF
jgi:hypothetical protein